MKDITVFLLVFSYFRTLFKSLDRLKTTIGILILVCKKRLIKSFLFHSESASFMELIQGFSIEEKKQATAHSVAN